MTKVALLLAVLALIGTIGYGVYSKFYTEGEFSGQTSINVSDFNPQIDNSGNGDSFEYIGSASSDVSGDMECYQGNTKITYDNKADLDSDVTCYKRVSVKNDGDKTVKIEFSNYDVAENSGLFNNVTDVTLYNEEKTETISNGFSLAPDESKTVQLAFTIRPSWTGDTTNHNGTTYNVVREYDDLSEAGSGESYVYYRYKVIAYEQ